MPGSIELYIRTKEYKTRNTQPWDHIKAVRNAHIIGGYDYMLTSSVDEWLSPEEIRVRKLAVEFARRHGLELIIRDRAGFWDNLRARLKGIGPTPAIVMGKHRFGPDMTIKQLEVAL